MNLVFEQPLILPLGVVALILGIASRCLFSNFLSLDIPLGPPGGVSFKPRFSIALFLRILSLLQFLGALLLVIAAAGPLLVTSTVVSLNRGADIIFVLDISPSMAGIDMDMPMDSSLQRGAPPGTATRPSEGRMNRYTAARILIKDFAEKRPSDAFGLVAVGKEAALLIPPTIDRALFNARLDSLMIGELGDGTALGLGLAIAALHITHSTAVRKAVILITDGENNAGSIHPEAAAEAVQRAGASLWVIGVGSTGDIPIDYVDPFTNVSMIGTYYSQYNPEALEAIAQSGLGQFFSAATGRAFSQAFAAIHAEEMTISRLGTVTNNQRIANPFILLGLLLILVPDLIRRFALGALW